MDVTSGHALPRTSSVEALFPNPLLMEERTTDTSTVSLQLVCRSRPGGAPVPSCVSFLPPGEGDSEDSGVKLINLTISESGTVRETISHFVIN